MDKAQIFRRIELRRLRSTWIAGFLGITAHIFFLNARPLFDSAFAFPARTLNLVLFAAYGVAMWFLFMRRDENRARLAFGLTCIA